jgi:hypothetical protein
MVVAVARGALAACFERDLPELVDVDPTINLPLADALVLIFNAEVTARL